MERLSIFALGIMPYISASIILELMTVVVPHLAQLKKEQAIQGKQSTDPTAYQAEIKRMQDLARDHGKDTLDEIERE